MFKIHFSRRILLGFILAFAILTWLAISSYLSTRKVISSSRWVAHTHDVLYHSEQVLAVAINIETGQRGYAITGNEQFLEPYNKAKGEIHTHINSLQALTGDNPDQLQLVEQIARNIDELLLFSSSAIQARTTGIAQAQQLNATMEGKRKLDSIRKLIAGFQEQENKLLRERAQASESYINAFTTNYISLLLTIVIILVFVFFAINANLRTRIETEEKLTAASAELTDLYDNAPCGYHSLNPQGEFVNINRTLLRWLGFRDREEVIGKIRFSDLLAERDLSTFHEKYALFMQQGEVYGLEFNLRRTDGTEFPVLLSSTAVFDDSGRYVKSRSNTFDNTDRKKAELQIKELAHELEAFSYSVSHDLRAPLRSIDGYAKVLIEDYAEKLDDEGKRVINVIMSNARRMGQLIDDLLDFARLGRKDIQRTQPDMTLVVKSIAEELLRQESRQVDLVVHPLDTAPVDLDMIRQVWINLISNALKYTGKTLHPKIEISSRPEGDSICFSIKDNGVGFDMQYIDKLFGVFQRLHKMQDFSGTGVGLAIVKRIIGRHQGKVWAEAKLDQGANFYFTIPHLNGKQ